MESCKLFMFSLADGYLYTQGGSGGGGAGRKRVSHTGASEKRGSCKRNNTPIHTLDCEFALVYDKGFKPSHVNGPDPSLA